MGHPPAVLANTCGSRSFIDSPHPEHFPRSGICRNDGSSIAGGEVQHSTDVNGCGFVLVFRRAANVVRAPGPGDLEIPDVSGTDLVERRVAIVPAIAAATTTPLRSLRSPLLSNDACHQPKRDDDKRTRPQPQQVPRHVVLLY